MNLQLSSLKPAIETNMLQYEVERDVAGGATPDFWLEAARERAWDAVASKRVTRPAFDSWWLLILTEFQGPRLFNLLSRWSGKPDPVQFKQAVLGLMYQSEIGRAALGLPPSSRTTDSAKKKRLSGIWTGTSSNLSLYMHTLGRRRNLKTC